jgi:hypothetical protein
MKEEEKEVEGILSTTCFSPKTLLFFLISKIYLRKKKRQKYTNSLAKSNNA